MNEQSRETVEERMVLVSGQRFDPLAETPISEGWFGSIATEIRGRVDTSGMPDDAPLAEVTVDKASYVDPETKEADVRYEARYEVLAEE